MDLSPSHLFCFITMINFFKQSVHSFFNNLTSTALTCQQQHSISADHTLNTMPHGCAGLSILASYDDIPKLNNVIESSSLINGSLNIKQAVASVNNSKRDHAEIKALGGGGAYGSLASCTESLGFESYTESSVSNEYGIDYYDKTGWAKKQKKITDKRKEKKYPPPLKSLNENGKPMFVLKPARKDGRLELKEVQIHRQQSLHACREEGRLRMYLVELGNDKEDNESSDSTKEEDNKLGDAKGKQVVEEEWKFPDNCGGGGGEDCRWPLNEMVVSHGHHHQHHHNMHGWGQRVTIT
ncbi:uncharacterized protein LOC141697890 [Apium graveolens]|uniref:uncharacterized protein LOC141697890 n=1 Tax=Apium graveolens TaxID=4045 RepID=UPI003D7A9DA5